MKFSKTLTMAVALVMASSSFLYARDRNRRQNDMMDKPSQDQGHMMQEGKMMSGYSAPARYDVKGAWDVYFTADFIYWQARSDGVAYGVSVVETTDAATNLTTARDRVLNVDFGWHPGVKLGIGGNSSRDDWDVYLEWTHYVSHNNTRSTPEEGGFILPATLLAGHPAQTVVVPAGSRAFSSWKCIYNTMDLELGRSYYLGKYLTFRPHAGIRGYWIRQRHNNQFDDVENTSGTTQFGTIRVNSKYNTWGIGPRFGLNTNWLLGCGFRLFGDVAGSIAWNSVSSRKIQRAPDSGTSPQIINVKDGKGNGNLRPNYDAELGIGWGSYFDNANWHFDVAIAYEFHYWPDHNFDLYFVDDIFEGLNDSIRGNVGLHGGTLRVRFDF